jgi:predicted DNA-binding protein (MmcQ/YjbR family)
MAKSRSSHAESVLRKFALAYPDTTEHFPWGHVAVKVKGKAFVFMSGEKCRDGTWSLSVKLPVSAVVALSLPFASPTEYGLGRSGWVTARFRPQDDIPVEMLKEWIDESFRAIAPRKVLAKMEQSEADGRPTKRRR